MSKSLTKTTNINKKRELEQKILILMLNLWRHATKFVSGLAPQYGLL